MGAVKQMFLENLDRGGFDSWHELAEWLDTSDISDTDIGCLGKEGRFIRDMVKLTASGKEPSPRQQQWLRDIYEREEEENYIDEVWKD